MWEDPIVAEVHRARRELAEKFDFDVIAIVADIRQRQAALGSRLVSLANTAEPAANRSCEADASESNSPKPAPAA
jgi:hypothetical protein